MTQPEYIAALLSIVVGLGLTDLAQSLRELVRPRRRVDWHWLPLLWAVTTFLVSIQLWWNAFSFLKEATSEFFLPFLAAFFFLYLTCAFALPDPEWQKPQAAPDADELPNSASVPLDLETFYFSDAHRRWYFGMFIAFLVTSQIGGQSVRVLEKYGANLEEILINAAFAGLLGTLALTDRWWVHAPISVLCFLGIGWATLTAIL